MTEFLVKLAGGKSLFVLMRRKADNKISQPLSLDTIDMLSIDWLEADVLTGKF